MKNSTFDFMKSSVAAERRALDALYERCEDFDELCAMAAGALVKKALTVTLLSKEPTISPKPTKPN